MTTLDELVVRVKADTIQLERKMKEAGQVTEQTGKKMEASIRNASVTIAAATAGLIAYSKGAIDAAGRITDLAGQVGFTTSTLAALELKLAASGASLEDLTSSVNLMNNALGEAAKGGEAQIEAFDELGLSVRKLQQMSPEQQFFEIASALGKVEEQYRFTENGRAIFGRGFSKLQPILKETGGDLKSLVDETKSLNEGLSAETIQTLDDFGDAMGRAGLKIRNDFMTAFAEIAPEVESLMSKLVQVPDVLRTVFIDLPSVGGNIAGNYLAGRGAIYTGSPQPRERQDLSDMQSQLNKQLKAKGLIGASGSNAGLGKPKKGSSKKETDELSEATENFVRKLEAANRIIEQNRTAYEVMLDESKRATELIGDDQEQLNRELQRAWMEYTSSFEQQTDQAKTAVEELSVSIRDNLANSFESAIFDAKNFGESMKSVFDGIARQIARNAFIDPLAAGVTDKLKGSSIFKSIGGAIGNWFGGARADGGPVGAGQTYLVGERGPELFTPNMSGAIVPNHKLGGGGVVLQQNFTINPSVQGAMRAEIMNALPMITQVTKNAVVQSTQLGGSDSRAFGRKA